MTQNIYDKAGFFAGYARLRRSVDGLDGAPEWPTLKSMLPDLADPRVVDLGCGFERCSPRCIALMPGGGPRLPREGPRTTDWLAKGVVKQHCTLATYLNLPIAAGFTVRRVEEWGPTRAEIAAHPEWKIDHRRPSFLLMSAIR